MIEAMINLREANRSNIANVRRFGHIQVEELRKKPKSEDDTDFESEEDEAHINHLVSFTTECLDPLKHDVSGISGPISTNATASNIAETEYYAHHSDDKTLQDACIIIYVK